MIQRLTSLSSTSLTIWNHFIPHSTKEKILLTTSVLACAPIGRYKKLALLGIASYWFYKNVKLESQEHHSDLDDFVQRTLRNEKNQAQQRETLVERLRDSEERSKTFEETLVEAYTAKMKSGQRIKELELINSRLGAELATQTAKLKMWDLWLKNRDAQNLAQQQTVQSLQSKVNDQDQLLRDKDTQISTLTDYNLWLCQHKDALIQTQQQTIHSLEHRVHETAANHSLLSQKLAHTESQLIAVSTEAQNQQIHSERLKEYIKQLKQTVLFLNRHIDHTNQQVQRFETYLSDLTREQENQKMLDQAWNEAEQRPTSITLNTAHRAIQRSSDVIERALYGGSRFLEAIRSPQSFARTPSSDCNTIPLSRISHFLSSL